MVLSFKWISFLSWRCFFHNNTCTHRETDRQRVLYSNFPLLINFTYSNVYVSMEAQEGGDICAPMAGSCCCTAEISTTLWSNYPPIKSKLRIFSLQYVVLAAQSCLTLCDPMDCSTPGLPVHHQPTEVTQTHVLRVGDAIQQSHPLLSPSPHTFNLSQHQGLFQWVGCSHKVAKVLEFQLQHQSFQWIFRTAFL